MINNKSIKCWFQKYIFYLDRTCIFTSGGKTYKNYVLKLQGGKIFGMRIFHILFTELEYLHPFSSIKQNKAKDQEKIFCCFSQIAQIFSDRPALQVNRLDIQI